jgi:hypothetical protein
MRKLGLSVLLMAVMLVMLAGSLLAAPELSIPEPFFDFGYVPQQATISHDFWLYSTGTELLVIEKVYPG